MIRHRRVVESGVRPARAGPTGPARTRASPRRRGAPARGDRRCSGYPRIGQKCSATIASASVSRPTLPPITGSSTEPRWRPARVISAFTRSSPAIAAMSRSWLCDLDHGPLRAADHQWPGRIFGLFDDHPPLEGRSRHSRCKVRRLRSGLERHEKVVDHLRDGRPQPPRVSRSGACRQRDGLEKVHGQAQRIDCRGIAMQP